jgi:hypothetical protein
VKKRQSQKAHSIRRAKERYGVTISRRILRAFINKIQSGKSVFVSRASIRVTKHFVEYEGTVYLVAYDTNRKMVCSFLPHPQPSDKGEPLERSE